MRRFRRHLASAVLVLASAYACSTEPESELVSLPRNLSTAETQLVSSGNAFSIALFQQVSAANPDSSIFISPLSASFALGMALNGARGQTFDDMRSAMQLNRLSQADINAGYRSLMDLLRNLDPRIQMDVANSIWTRNTIIFSPAFLDSGKTYFDAQATALDFNDVVGSTGKINSWVSAKTHGRIPTILDDISPADMMLLVNAIYFKGLWRTQFDPAKTRAESFKTSTGQIQQVPTMVGNIPYRSQCIPTACAIDLPYGNAAFNLTIISPRGAGAIDQLVSSLTLVQWDSLVSGMSDQQEECHMPKFILSYARELTPDLTVLGMGRAFSDAADFSGLTGSANGMQLTSVLQKAWLQIDEQGTEAAAATEVSVGDTAREFVDIASPFVFAIRERLSGTIMFIGKINRIPQ